MIQKESGAPPRPSSGAVMKQGSKSALLLVDRKPRVLTVLNIGTYVLQGMILGLAMGFLSSLATSGLPKIWTYVANTFAVMLLKVILQWIWVLNVTSWVREMATWFIMELTGRRLPETVSRQISVTNQVSIITSPAIVAVAVATILSTENIEPSWLTNTWAIVLISTLGGGLASAMEALGLPSNIYALRWNRHPYQENPIFLQRTKRRRPNNDTR